jgi:hypothetical protein
MDERVTVVPVSTFDLGALIGRGQAFGLVTSHCSAAQAECLAHIREAGLYKALNLTWDEFCEQHAGASRAHVDDIIRQLKEFGAAYFRLSEIIRISPQSYRMIEGTVKDEAIEIDGQSIPIIPENAPRIRQAIAALRAELPRADAARARSSLGITLLQARLDACFEEMSSMSVRPLDIGERAAFQGLIRYSFNKLKRVARQAQNIPQS